MAAKFQFTSVTFHRQIVELITVFEKTIHTKLGEFHSCAQLFYMFAQVDIQKLNNLLPDVRLCFISNLLQSIEDDKQFFFRFIAKLVPECSTSSS